MCCFSTAECQVNDNSTTKVVSITTRPEGNFELETIFAVLLAMSDDIFRDTLLTFQLQH